MNTIPQTFTMVDSQMEHRKLRDEIAQSKMEKEIADREKMQAIEARDAIHRAHKSSVLLSEIKDVALEGFREKIRGEISEMKEKKNKLTDDINIKQEEKKEVESKLMASSAKLDACYDRINKILEDITKETLNLNNFRKQKADEENAVNGHIVSLYLELQKLSEQKNEYKIEYEKKRNEIFENEQRIAKKESDINIYELRLRTKCTELYPDMEIIL